MQDLNGPAVVRGMAEKNREPVEFHDSRAGYTRAVPSKSGIFRVLLPQGHYTVQQGTTHTAITVLSGGNYNLDLRRDKAVDYTATSASETSGDVVLRVAARGVGRHTFSIRSDNLGLKEPPQATATLNSDKASEIVWHAHISSPDIPWVAVIIADDVISNRRELTGTAPPQSAPAD
jgi:hypothetical protein